MPRIFMPLTLLVVLTACTGQSGADSTTSTVAPNAPTTEVASTTTVTEPAPGSEDLPPLLQDRLAELIALTEELRELEFIEPPVINVVSPEELERLVREEIESSTEDVEVDQALYELLGLVDEGTSLMDLYTDVLGEQVGGFYNLETKEMVVPLRSDDFGPLERNTIVHELTHALTDQHFDFGTDYLALVDGERYDEAAAFQAVFEGDAVLTELAFLTDLPVEEQREVIEESLAIDSSALDSAPRFLQESLIFPYVQGRTFMDRLYQLEGREGVDGAYTEPPVSTEQIITPDDYRRDQPIEVSLPIIEVEGYEMAYESVWGELSVELMFNQVLGSRPDAAEGWGGDRYRVFYGDGEVAMVLMYKGDSVTDTEEMESAMLDYLAATLEADDEAGQDEAEQEGATFEGDEFGYVSRNGDELLFVVASDPSAGEAILGSFPES